MLALIISNFLLTIDRLLHRKPEIIYSPCSSPLDFVDKFVYKNHYNQELSCQTGLVCNLLKTIPTQLTMLALIISNFLLTIDRLLHRKPEIIYSPCSSPLDLVDKFVYKNHYNQELIAEILAEKSSICSECGSPYYNMSHKFDHITPICMISIHWLRIEDRSV